MSVVARSTLCLVLAIAGADAQPVTDRSPDADVRDAPARARALAYIAHADSLLRAGRAGAAESLYYAVSRWRPRDPAPRIALGRYLASRGATYVGATLIEEARRFGASPSVAALHLAPLYARLGAWEALRDLPASPLGAAERARAAWLAARPAVEEGPDSVWVPMAAARVPGAAGAVVLHLGADSVVAEIDPEVSGVVLDRARASGVRRFAGAASDPVPEVGVIERAALGALVIGDVPVRFAALGGPGGARVGLDFLARWAPTARDGRLLLRRSARAGSTLPGERHALLLDPTVGARVARQGRLVSPSGLLRGRSWTIDPRRGELITH